MQPIDSSLAPLYVIGKPVRRTCVLRPTVLVARFATLVRDCTVHIDHLSAEITLSAMTHLPSLDVKVFHFDIELMERTGRQPDEHLFAVVWITFLWRVREYPILAVLPVTTRPSEIVWASSSGT